LNRLFASAGAIALAALLGWSSYQIMSQWSSDRFAACRTGNIAGGPIGGPFTLVDETGQSVTDAQVFAKPALVYFGYGSCPDVCPLDNARNVEAVAELSKLGYDVTPIFITVDPARDTPAALTEYTDVFGETLLGLTGTADQIKTAAAAFKVYYKVPTDVATNYEVDHTTFTYLMLPQTGFADFFLRDTSAKEMAERTGCFLKSS
jgi:protein SCO1